MLVARFITLYNAEKESCVEVFNSLEGKVCNRRKEKIKTKRDESQTRGVDEGK